jgi:O-antigen/teichoic acid export membrane protein
VIGVLAGSALSAAAALVRRPIRPAWPDDEVRGLMTYATHVLTGSIAWATYSSADLVVAGKVIGASGAGVYALAWTIANLPTERLLNVVTAVTRSAFAAVRESASDIARYLLGMLEGTGVFLVLPLIGLLMVADLAVPLVLGQKWQHAVPALRLLIIAACFSAVGVVLSQVLTARGLAGWNARVAIATALTLVPGFIVGARLAGAVGVAAAWCIVNPAIVWLRWRRTASDISLPGSAIVSTMGPSFVATVLMVAVLLVGRALRPVVEPGWARLLAEIALGALVAVATLMTRPSPLVRMLRDSLAHRLLGRRDAAVR